VFKVRLMEYYKKTAPLIGYYWAKGAGADRRPGRHEAVAAASPVLDKA
jgi:hypothetical protein